MKPEATHAYAGFCVGCGSMVAASVDAPEYARNVAKDIAGFVRDGLRVERLTIEAVRAGFHICTCPKNPRKRSKRVTNEQVDMLGGANAGTRIV